MRPELRQFGELTQQDFDRFAVWVGVHAFDSQDEPWYEETDEETFRPWLEEIPVNPEEGMFLIRARLILSDGTEFGGFITPAIGIGEATDSNLGEIQPHLFSPNSKWIRFWGGMPGFSDEAKESVYKLLERSSDKIFPIRFEAIPGLTTGIQSGKVRGFYKSIRDDLEISF